MTLFSSWFWPDASNRKNALAAINEAFWATIFLAALTAIFTFIANRRRNSEHRRKLSLLRAAATSSRGVRAEVGVM